MMQGWADEYYKDKTKEILQKKYFNILCEKSKEIGLKLSEESKSNFNPEKEWASVHIYNELIKYEENKKILPEGTVDSFNNFSKKYCGDVNSKLYIDKSADYPSLKEAIDVVKKCDGLVFLPHIYIYKWAEDKNKLLDNLVHEYNIDGIECMHSEFNQEQINYLMDYTNKNGLLRSGGSDYHGINKKNIEMAVGKGNLKITSDLIKSWC